MTMITAKNYAAQAERDFRKGAENLRAQNMELDALMVDTFASLIKDAEHFAIPDNGVIFDDNARGVVDTAIRLPYPVVTVEYFVDGSMYKNLDPRLVTDAPKRLVLAFEIDGEFVERAPVPPAFINGIERILSASGSDRAIYVAYGCTTAQGGNRFIPGMGGWILPSRWDALSGNKIEPISPNLNDDGIMVCGSPTVILPSTCMRLERQVGREQLLRNITHDIGQEVAALIELIEALSCNNIETEVMTKAKQSRNSRGRKRLPVYETKHLVLTRPGTATSRASAGSRGDRASPRQHLRRGHIRRCSAGNVWVNSCVVGSLSNGRIDKDYSVCS